MVTAGQGSHFKEVHGHRLDLRSKANLKVFMDSFKLVVVANVCPPANPEEQVTCQAHLDRLEGDLQHRLRCLDEHGGMNVRDENNRSRGR